MKTNTIIPVIAALAIAPCTVALAGHDGAQITPAATLLYLDQHGWEQASGAAKIALATDFMRVFCGNPAMPAAGLVECLDRSGDAGSIFARAMACVATAPVSPSR
jgi:mannose/cellobiose epimerase-like protein (N-acyl-D-glucosamine 2-epimerase family)